MRQRLGAAEIANVRIVRRAAKHRGGFAEEVGYGEVESKQRILPPHSQKHADGFEVCSWPDANRETLVMAG